MHSLPRETQVLSEMHFDALIENEENDFQCFHF